MEFINDSQKTYFTRKDKFGYYWIENNKNTNGNGLGNMLFELQSEIDSTITYQIDKITNDTKYTEKDITIQQQKQTQNEFIIYNHKLVDSKFIKKTYLFYNGNKIEFIKNEKITTNEDKLENLENQSFTEICTYVLQTISENHLLIKLTKDGSKVYYLQRFNRDGTKWRQMFLQNVKDAGVNINGQTKVENVLTDLANTKFLLEFINFQIYSIIVLINNKKKYEKEEIEKIVGSINSEKEVPPIDISSNSINVKNLDDNHSSCLSSDKYKLWTHNLKTAVRIVEDDPALKLHIRLYFEETMIRLYDDDAATMQTFLTYYPGETQLYTYFHDSGNIPLLLCYNSNAYRPKDKINYNTKWVKVKSLNTCVCNSRANDQNSELLAALSNVAGFFNVVYLSKKEGSGQGYTQNKLFKVYKIPQLENLKPGSIDVYKEEGSDERITLKDSGDYNKKPLDYIQLYFNKYENNTPLILVLHFKQPKKHKPKYYLCSKFNTDKGNSMNMSELPIFHNEKDLLDILMRDNDQLTDILTFDLEKTYGSYNGDKIDVKDDSRGIANMLGRGFKRFKHTPKSKFEDKNSCVIYRNDVLYNMNEVSPKVIENIQNQIYGYIIVYYSNSKVVDPLLIELNQRGHNQNNNSFYYHSRDNKGSLHWKQVTGGTVLNTSFTSGSIHYQMVQGRYPKLIDFLKQIESCLTKSLVFIINRQIGKYDKNAIKFVFGDHNNYRIINKEVNVGNKHGSNYSCLTEKGFKVIEHDFGSSVQDVKLNEEVNMIFIIANRTNGHSLINLIDEDGRNINFKYSLSHNKLYVYTYGRKEQNASTPLLLCYNGQAFSPKDMINYNLYKWNKVKNNSACTCGSKPTESLLDALSNVIGFLNVVKLDERPPDGSITVKEPNQIGKEPHTYNIHQYNDQQIKIKVTYHNKACYRLYIHKPYGTSGDGSNFRLGTITCSNGSNLPYDTKQELDSVTMYYNVYDHKHNHPLLLVLKFKHVRYPEKYFKPTSKEDKKWEEIQNIEDFQNILSKLKDDSTIEDGLYDLRKKLKIEFENKENYLFKPDLCKEDKISIAAVAGGTVGAAAVVGTGITVGIVVAKKLIIAAATTAVVA
ncbi:hypothetical protein MACK_000191 [Theileria orientalis]|uniref:Uncharacterized protein n=1 Tax=Theileria orientalis TaxID=68886 RepID=A0A976QWE3_THEOR|nr:hypothetical protein MACK_000191 [Theileria orientalis]